MKFLHRTMEVVDSGVETINEADGVALRSLFFVLKQRGKGGRLRDLQVKVSIVREQQGKVRGMPIRGQLIRVSLETRRLVAELAARAAARRYARKGR